MRSLLPSLRPSIFTSTFGGFGLGDRLWDVAGLRPSLDLQLATSKSLTDAVTGASLVTFTRASSGTFVDSAGVLQTAVTNLLLRSEEFDNAYWSPSGSSITANNTTAPNETITADLLIENSASSAHLVSAGGGMLSGTTYTYSVYAKAAGRDWLLMSPGSTWGYGWFNINNGTLGTLINGGSNPTAAISAVGNGWYRCSITLTAVANAGIQFLMAPSNGTVTYTGNGTSGIYIWGAQLEQSATVGEYIPTTSAINSAPRSDHNPTTGESLGLLVEEQRTNLKTYSDAILSGNVYGVNVSTLATITTATPTGSATASLFTMNVGANTGNNTDGFNFGSSITLTNSTQHTQSLFVKPAGATVLRLRSNISGLVFDFTLTGNGTAPSPISDLQSASIVPLANGWYRVSWTFTTTTSAPGNRSDYWTIKTNVADGTNGFYVVGAQLEAGAFPTSYIPTTTATVTRAADVASITGSAFNSFYNQSEGTVFVDGSTAALTGTTGFVAINAAGNTNRIEIRQSRNTPNMTGASAGDVIWTNVVLSPTIVANTSYKQAVAFSNASHGNSIAGSLDTSSTTIGTIAATQLFFGIRASQTAPTGGSSSTIKRLTFWPQRLGNSTLPALTQ